MAQQAPITTIPPFSDVARLPDCAKECGPLYDANGACVPPAAPAAEPAAYTACFCAHPKVSPLSRGPDGVCGPAACAGNQQGLQSIAKWFQGIRSAAPAAQGQPNQLGATSTAGNANGVKQMTGSAAGNATGGDWLSSHWQWVIMIVVLVGIAAIWIGACVWRRRYLRKKDSGQLASSYIRQNKNAPGSHPPWGPAVPGSDSTTPMTYGHDPERSLAEKPAGSKDKPKKTWNVTRRT